MNLLDELASGRNLGLLSLCWPNWSELPSLPTLASPKLSKVLASVTYNTSPANLTRDGCREEQPYEREPESAYQRAVRGTATVLRDHICKEMNDLNLERCRSVVIAEPAY